MNFMKREQTWYPIEKIALFESTVADGIAATEENYATFLEAKNKPHVLDDSIIDRAIRLYSGQIEDVGYIDQQNTRWRKGTLTASQQDRVDALAYKSEYFRKLTEKTLFLVKELRKGTINRIIEMSDEEVALKVLSGEIVLPNNEIKLGT